MPGKAAKITITEKQQAILLRLSRSRTEGVSLVQRSQIILLAFDGHNNESIETEVGLHHDGVGRWRRRWRDSWEKLIDIECREEPHVLASEIKKLLSDRPRSGRKPRIDAQQQAAIFKTACESPEKKNARSHVGAEANFVAS
jgi:transposase